MLCDPVLVVGGGIGGLATALSLHERGIGSLVFEQSPRIRELGVGINTLPHAIAVLADCSRSTGALCRASFTRRCSSGSAPEAIHRLEEVLPHVRRFEVPHVDVEALVRATAVFYEYPVCDRDPLTRWSHGRVTLLGDAAHPMYPVGSNGASQAVLDARALAAELAGGGGVEQALHCYQSERLPITADVVHSNRRGGPEGVIDAVEALAPDGFEDVESVLAYDRREAIVRGYAQRAGFAVAGAPQHRPTRSSTREQEE